VLLELEEPRRRRAWPSIGAACGSSSARAKLLRECHSFSFFRAV
jgi:hypothetical protein